MLTEPQQASQRAVRPQSRIAPPFRLIPLSEIHSSYYRARYYDPSAGRFLNEDPINFDGGYNFYKYVHNNPANGRDPLGLWDTNTHSALYWNALKPCGVADATIYRIQQESATLDATTQAPWDAPIHSMKAPLQSPASALNERDNWITSNLNAAALRFSQGPSAISTVGWDQLLADALHTITDSTSPVHMENGVPLSWPWGANALHHGDWPIGDSETWANMTPQLMQQNIDAIRAAWEKVTGKKCGCAQ